MHDIILICGYKRTGKDTLYENLTLNGQYNWSVYRNSQKELKLDKNYSRFSFADELKKEVSKIYGIPFQVDDKDLKQYKRVDGKIASARDLYIEWGTIKRKQDPYYWCKFIKKDKCIITDWRYPNELEYVANGSDTSTVRVFRSSVPVPDQTIESEHSLDKFTTDFLVLDNCDDLAKVQSLFPQYKDYTFYTYI